MDENIALLFKEKNNKILIDKLLLDIDNNDDSLRLTVSNKIKLVTLKLQRRSNDLFKADDVEYDMKSLSELIEELIEQVKEYVFSQIDSRKEKFKSIVNSNPLELCEGADIENKNDIHNTYNPEINNLIYVNLLNKLVSEYKLTDSNLKDELIEKCLKKYDFELSSSIEDSILDRNRSLKNVAQETISKVSELNNKTTNVSTEETKDERSK